MRGKGATQGHNVKISFLKTVVVRKMKGRSKLLITESEAYMFLQL